MPNMFFAPLRLSDCDMSHSAVDLWGLKT